MGEPIERGTGEAFAAEDFGPVLEGQVRGHDQAVPFVGRGDDVEQEFGSGLAGGNVAQFVEDDQIELGQLLRTADVEAALSDAATTLRSALEALPYDLAPELAPITDEGQLRAKLVEAIEATLAELSRRFGAMARREAA